MSVIRSKFIGSPLMILPQDLAVIERSLSFFVELMEVVEL